MYAYEFELQLAIVGLAVVSALVASAAGLIGFAIRRPRQ